MSEDMEGEIVLEDDCCGGGNDKEGEGIEVDQTKTQEPLVMECGSSGGRKARIAVAGCSHGEMDKIYEVMALIEEEKGYKFDLLICCGDYQSVRNYGDLHHMHVNEKYRSLQTFYKYYSGEAVAPVLTLFIGGNHEASGYLCELPNGGWVAPKIYYMGFAGVVRFAGLRIAGFSGIYNGREFNMSHFERPPFSSQGDKIGVYHTRNVDMFRLRQLKADDADGLSNPIDIMLSHDWPAGIADFGDVDWLLRVKKHFREDYESGRLGNPASMKVLYDVRPRYWLAAHLHVAFAALVPHKAVENKRPAPTKFLSLDKPQPQRQFIQSLELCVAEDAEMKLSYDPHWLAILRSTDFLTVAKRQQIFLPDGKGNSEERMDFRPTSEELQQIELLGDLTIKENFRHTAPPLIKITPESKNAPSSAYYRNPQTAEFCQWLGIQDLNKMLVEMDPENVGTPWYMMTPTEQEKEQQVEEQMQNDLDFGDEDFVIDRGDVKDQEEEKADEEEDPPVKKARTDSNEDGEEEDLPIPC